MSRRAFVGRANNNPAFRMRAPDLDDGAETGLGRVEPIRQLSEWRRDATRAVRAWLSRAFDLAPHVVEHDGATMLRVEVADRDEERRWSVYVVDGEMGVPVNLDDRVTVAIASHEPDAVAWLNAAGVGVLVVDEAGVRQVGDRRLRLCVAEPHREVVESFFLLGGSGGAAMHHLLAIYLRRRELRANARASEWAAWNRPRRRRYIRTWRAENRERVRAAEATPARKAAKAASDKLRRAKQTAARQAARSTPEAIAAKAARSAELRATRRAREAAAFKARYASDPEFRARIKASQARSAARRAA